ncbi:hypothetical protein CBS76997_10857 [Aspergillus niger]|nr:hypothetical protein CBS133816_10386 [Aspergillus niger]KAI2837932.1 hypothetical protein CBS11350_8467 [Aspergillus niger]KAI2848952.1 hypothetical protein CBS12448_9000 [Aspergillus niger]KAI2872811.1 hypothetical protein CBS13152_9937 [Aspergillus niger]KAI2913973.1 hypothetical protein CBS147371_6654 [Aspergillus niger]
MGGFLSVQSKEKRRRTNRLSKPPPNRATLASNSFRASRQTSGTSSPTECPACTAWQDPWTGTSISLKAPEPDKAQLASESADEQSHNAEIVRDSGHEVDLTSFDLSNIQDYASESAIEQSRKAEIVRDSALDKVDLTSFDLSNIQDYAPVPLEWEIPTIILQAHFPSRDLQQPQLRTDFKVAKQKMKVFLSLMKENGLSTSLNVPSENTGIENSNMRRERLTAATVPQPPSVPLDDRLILAHLHINLEWPADLHSTVIQRTTGFWMPETAQNLALSPLYTVIQAFRVLGQGPKSTAMAGRPTDGQCVMTSDRCPLNRA